jgi:hypothetical protein
MKYVTALIALALASCTVRSSPLFQQPRVDKRLIDLQREKDKLKRLTDPVGRTKTSIKISDILISLSSEAARNGDIEIMDQRLDDYVATIQEAHQTMMKTGRDAHKKSAGYRDLEIALRKQINQLKDVGQAVTFDQRAGVEKARDEAARIRDDLLKAIFGGPNGTPN